MMRCPSCGAQVPVDDLDCTSCGAGVGWWVRNRGGEESGPYTFVHMQEMTRQGLVGPQDRIRIGLIGEWVSAPEVLSPDFQRARPPVTAAHKPGRRAHSGSNVPTLLIVGVVVVALAGATAFVVSRWPQRPRGADPSATCQGNLSRLARAVRLYVYDQGAPFPQWQDWGAAASARTKDLAIFVCPAAPTEPGYAYNAALSGLPPVFVRHPDRCVMLWDAGALGGFPGLSPSGQGPRHGGGDNFAFVDGHVAWHPRGPYLETDIELQP